MKSNERILLETFLNHNNNISKVRSYIKENFNIDSEYNEETNTLHLYSTNVNESSELLLAKEYILSQIDESMLNIKYGF